MVTRLIVFVCLISVLSSRILSQETTVYAQTNPFGIVEGFWSPEATCELGVGWERIIFDWSQHQPTSPDEWHTLNVDDRWLKSADACQREVVALLKHTPAWATDGTPSVGLPRGLELPLDHPENYWAQFVRKTVGYYASRGVNHFIIWNEPDIDQQTYGYEFEGDLEDYFQLLKTAYLVANEVNPAAVIHLAGTTYWHDVNEGRKPYVARLIDRINEDPDAEANGYYFDAVSLHIYFRTETVYDIVNEFRRLLDDNGLHEQSIWVTETNAAPTDDPDWPVERPVYQLDLEQQAAFLVQAASLALAGGAERIAVYKLIDQELPPGGESFGILSPKDGTARPAFAAWRFVTDHFADVVDARLLRTETAELVLLQHENGSQSLVAWARKDQPIGLTVEAKGGKAYLLDQYGNMSIVRPVDGVYNLNLSAARCNDVDGCAVGGNVTTLVLPSGNITVVDPNTDQALDFVQE